MYQFSSALKTKAEISSETLINGSQSTFLYFHKIVFFRVTTVRTSECTNRLSVHERGDYKTANLVHMYLGHQRLGNQKRNITKSQPCSSFFFFAITFLAWICRSVLSFSFARWTWFDSKWLTVMAVCKSVTRLEAIAVTSCTIIKIT